jgi:hypothetical protein
LGHGAIVFECKSAILPEVSPQHDVLVKPDLHIALKKALIQRRIGEDGMRKRPGIDPASLDCGSHPESMTASAGKGEYHGNFTSKTSYVVDWSGNYSVGK